MRFQRSKLGPNEITALDLAMTLLSHVERRWRGASSKVVVGYMNPARTKQALMALLTVSMLAIGGCTERKRVQDYALADSGHRLVRVSFRGQKGSFRMRINGQPVEKFANASFTNTMMAFRFEYGDIVLWEAVRDERGREYSNPDELRKWWFDYLGQVRTSFYSINSDNIRDFFATPIYHWKAPFQKPRHLPDASFYCNGEGLGKGAPGFCAMLDSFESKRKSDTPFTLAPRIKYEDGSADFEQLLSWLEESGASAKYKVIYPTEIVDFARGMDEP
jgi:hypothetical protein